LTVLIAIIINCWHGYLSVLCSEVQMICIWSSWCQCHPIISDLLNLYGARLPKLSWKRGVCLSNCCIINLLF